MLLFRDLNGRRQKYHLTQSGKLISNRVYCFEPPIEIVPLMRQAKGSFNFGVPITVSRGRYLFARVMKDCLFSVEEGWFTDPADEGVSAFRVALFFLPGGAKPEPV